MLLLSSVAVMMAVVCVFLRCKLFSRSQLCDLEIKFPPQQLQQLQQQLQQSHLNNPNPLQDIKPPP